MTTTECSTGEMIQRYVAMRIKQGEEQQEEFVASIEKGGMLHSLSWVGNTAERVALADICRIVAVRRAADANDDSDVAWLRAIRIERERAIDGLLSDQWRGTSTSAFSNAVDHAKRAAAGTFVRETEGLTKEETA